MSSRSNLCSALGELGTVLRQLGIQEGEIDLGPNLHVVL